MVTLTDDDWKRLNVLWQGCSKLIAEAKTERYEIGKRLAAERLKANESQRLAVGDFPPPDHTRPGARETRPWLIRSHPDEWITYKVHEVDGAQMVDVVRFPPGASIELDNATAKVNDYTWLSKQEVEAFFSTHNKATGR